MLVPKESVIDGTYKGLLPMKFYQLTSVTSDGMNDAAVKVRHFGYSGNLPRSLTLQAFNSHRHEFPTQMTQFSHILHSECNLRDSSGGTAA